MEVWGPIRVRGPYRVDPMGLWGPIGVGDPIGGGGPYKVDPIGVWGLIGVKGPYRVDPMGGLGAPYRVWGPMGLGGRFYRAAYGALTPYIPYRATAASTAYRDCRGTKGTA